MPREVAPNTLACGESDSITLKPATHGPRLFRTAPFPMTSKYKSLNREQMTTSRIAVWLSRTANEVRRWTFRPMLPCLAPALWMVAMLRSVRYVMVAAAFAALMYGDDITLRLDDGSILIRAQFIRVNYGSYVPELAFSLKNQTSSSWRIPGWIHRAEVLDERTAVVVVEDVEQAAIQHSVELLVERSQLQGIMDQEAHGQAAVAGLGFGKSDCGRSRIDASRLQSHAGGHESVLAGPATHVQDPASNGARFHQRQKGRLRPPDVPRGRASIEGVKILGPPRPHRARQLLGRGGRRLILFRAFHVRASQYQHNPFTGGPVLEDHSALRYYVPAPGPWLPIWPHIVSNSGSRSRAPAARVSRSLVVSHMRCIGSAPAR